MSGQAALLGRHIQVAPHMPRTDGCCGCERAITLPSSFWRRACVSLVSLAGQFMSERGAGPFSAPVHGGGGGWPRSCPAQRCNAHPSRTTAATVFAPSMAAAGGAQIWVWPAASPRPAGMIGFCSPHHGLMLDFCMPDVVRGLMVQLGTPAAADLALFGPFVAGCAWQAVVQAPIYIVAALLGCRTLHLFLLCTRLSPLYVDSGGSSSLV